MLTCWVALRTSLGDRAVSRGSPGPIGTHVVRDRRVSPYLVSRVASPDDDTGEQARSVNLLETWRLVSRIFFPSSVADVALMARSLHESKQTKLCTRTKSPWNQQIDRSNKTKTTTTQKATTRKSPSQTCVSPAETVKQTAKKTTQSKNGARAQTKTPTESICSWTQWQIHWCELPFIEYLAVKLDYGKMSATDLSSFDI